MVPIPGCVKELSAEEAKSVAIDWIRVSVENGKLDSREYELALVSKHSHGYHFLCTWPDQPERLRGRTSVHVSLYGRVDLWGEGWPLPLK